MKFNHATTGFPLQGQHATVACVQCHSIKNFSGAPTTCFSCHQKDFVRALTPNHVLGKFSHDCITCHTMNGWQPSIFDHSKTNFPLIGAHRSVDCASCHTNNVFAGLSHDCFSCHQKDFAQTVSPNHQTGQFSHDCMTCHTMTAWKPATFDHSKTNFPLVGAHATVDCASCHKNGQFVTLPTDCFSCHQQDFASTKSPNHQTGKFTHDCMTCHTMTAWKPATFDHSKTSFPLVGAHATVACASCHKNGQFKAISTDCFSCHQTDFVRVSSPNHVSGQFSHDCTTCHSMTAWQPSTFDHSKTAFPLVGAHTTVDCASCHKNGQFATLPTDCYSCHATDFANAASPNHVSGQFSHDCTTCHSMTAWQPSTFDHSKTSFPLVGAHTTVACASCHKNGQFTGLPTDCYSCHATDFANAASPNHVAGQFSHDCTTCHSTTAWQPSTFDHSKTAFPLVGAHTTVACASCHKNGQFTSLPTDCYSCHATDFANVASPNHVAGQFSHDCTTCHSTTAWQPSTFDHSKTAFPLVGAHTTVACASCHKNGQFTSLPTDCYSCHATDFANVASPNHVAGQFSHDCTTCHSTTAWQPSTFDHSKTSFPLTGAHLTTDCMFCHKNGQFQGTPTDCWSCHSTDFAGTTNPNHQAGNFDHNCLTCHNTTAWQPATFDHNTTKFPLTGAHTSLQCQSCHTAGNFQLVYSGCYACHSSDYNGTTNPNHASAGFPTTCETCHTTTTWAGATFNHTWFPTSHGNANGVCATCHTNPSDYKVFTCTNCHTQAQTDPHHTGVRNYVYSSTACYSCHPSGSGD